MSLKHCSSARVRRDCYHASEGRNGPTSSTKYFGCEGFDYEVWQKNSNLMKRAITFATTALGRPASECMFLSGLYGPPDPPMAQAYGLWLPLKLYSFCYWAFDQFCLNSRPVPLEIAGQMQVTAATYYKPLAARAMESVIAVPVGAVAGGALNRFEANTRKCNG
jgi:hypothetical protein